MSTTTPGNVCAHHHLYSGLVPYFAEPIRFPTGFEAILREVWWKLDTALDLDTIHASALVAALDALEHGTTAIIDHHESPNAIEGSLDAIASACAEVGVRVVCAYGVTDRHGPDGAARGLAENRRFLAAGGAGLVGVHAAFTCSDDTLAAAAALAAEFGTGVHVHVAEGTVDADAAARLVGLTTDAWLLAHCVHLADDAPLRGTIAHNPRSNTGNGVGYARPARFGTAHRVVLGTDGIDGDMAAERDAAAALATPELADAWLAAAHDLVPATRDDRVTWAADGHRAVEVVVDGEVLLRDGRPTRVDADEIRAKAREAAERVRARMG